MDWHFAIANPFFSIDHRMNLTLTFLSAEMQTDLAYKVGWSFGEAFDRYLNDNKSASTTARVCFNASIMYT